jgi:hypothetical protein
MLTDILAWLGIIGMFLYVWFISGAFGEAVGLALSPRKHSKPRRKFPDRTPKKDPVKPAEKRPKQTSYPTVTSYNEEHRITNPVEFDT